MAGVPPETTGGMMFETSIGGKKTVFLICDCPKSMSTDLLAREFISFELQAHFSVTERQLLPDRSADSIAIRWTT
jgi:hypothetical protein